MPVMLWTAVKRGEPHDKAHLLYLLLLREVSFGAQPADSTT